MANKRKDTMEIKQILLLYTRGYSIRRIAKQLGFSRNTVRKYLDKFREQGLEDWEEVPESDLSQLFTLTTSSERHQKLLDYFPEVLRKVKQTGFTYKKMLGTV